VVVVCLLALVVGGAVAHASAPAYSFFEVDQGDVLDTVCSNRADPFAVKMGRHLFVFCFPLNP
jgi:hypothetical protein